MNTGDPLLADYCHASKPTADQPTDAHRRGGGHHSDMCSLGTNPNPGPTTNAQRRPVFGPLRPDDRDRNGDKQTNRQADRQRQRQREPRHWAQTLG